MKDIAAQLKDSSTPELDARLMVERAAGDEALLRQMVERRVAREPMAQILGRKGFWTLDLAVSRDVLTPRPDTETVIDALLRQVPDKARPLRILDLGTGSGCLILAALSEYANATGDAVDVSEAALAVARKNAAGARVEFFHGSWCEALPEGRVYDVILSNPPYIPRGEIAGLEADVREYEPHLALDGGADGLDCYRALAKQVGLRMVDGATLLLEVGAGQSDDVVDIMKRSGLKVADIANDLAGVARVVVLKK